jgi:LPXTG-motif cell wall-anchored protein
MTRTGRSGSSLRRWLVLSVAVLAAPALAAPALAQSPENTIRGEITEVSRSAEVVLVEENPSDESGSAKGEFAVDDETEILEQRDGDLAPVAFEDLRVGQMVEATYSGPVAESYPTQGVAGRIVILDEDRTDDPTDDGPSVLPNTGGAPLAGLLLIGGALLALRVARYSLR